MVGDRVELLDPREEALPNPALGVLVGVDNSMEVGVGVGVDNSTAEDFTNNKIKRSINKITKFI